MAVPLRLFVEALVLVGKGARLRLDLLCCGGNVVRIY
jgi:hypothetical protein